MGIAMPAIFKKIKNLLGTDVMEMLAGLASSGAATEATPCDEPNVYRNTFQMKLDNPFNADELFADKPGKALAARLHEKRLTKAAKKGVVFPHVVIEMSSQAVQNDLLRDNGGLARRLTAGLVDKHTQFFGEEMEGAQARYVVRRDASLAPDEICINFGQAVYVPDVAEPRAWTLEWSMDGAIWTEVGGIYERQALAVVGGKRAFEKFPEWQFGEDYSVVLMQDINAGTLTLLSEPADSLTIEQDDDGYYQIGMAGSDKFCCLKATRLTALPMPAVAPAMAAGTPPDAVRAAPPLVAATAAAATANAVQPAAAASASAPLKAAAVLAGAAASTAAAGALSNRQEPVLGHATPPQAEEAEDAEGTIVGVPPRPHATVEDDEATAVPIMASRPWKHRVGMSLAGIALQRVSHFAAYDVAGLHFAVDAGGNVVAPGSGSAILTFAVNSGDELSVESGTGTAALAIGQAVRVSSTLKVKIDASPKDDTLLGVYRLPVPVFEELGQGARFTFGRGEQTVLKTLRKLNGRGFLHAVKDHGGDLMGLSRRHFELEVAAQGLVVTPHVDGGRLLHLDENLSFVERMDMGTQESWTIPAGHHVVAGHYVLRYDA